MVKPVPDGYHTVTPYLIVAQAAEALKFYARAFGAVERDRMQDPAGKVHHAEITIGNSAIMLADEHPEMGSRAPQTVGGSPVGLMLYVENVDAVILPIRQVNVLLLRVLGKCNVPSRARAQRALGDESFLHVGSVRLEHLDAVIHTVTDIQ